MNLELLSYLQNSSHKIFSQNYNAARGELNRISLMEFKGRRELLARWVNSSGVF